MKINPKLITSPLVIAFFAITILSSCKPEVPEPNTYTVSFDANGGTGKMESITANEGSEITLTPNAFTKTGYTFTEWNTEPDGTGDKYVDEEKFKLTANTTLYAQWTVSDYKITYNLDGGTNADGNPASYTIETETVALKSPTKDGFTFVCWYSDRSKKTEIAKGSTGDIVLQAVWKDNADFVKVPAVSITGSETWTPTSKVFVSGRVLDIKAFYMCDHEVTREEYKKIMGSDPSRADAYDKDGSKLTGPAAGNNPVDSVSWYDAIVYCNKRSIKEGLTPCYTINGSTNPNDWGAVPTSSDSTWNAATCDFEVNGYRLPTEAEWEWAARGGENYKYAGSDNLDDVAWYTENTNDTGTREVKTKKPNGYGLYDMSGNVFEWCWDWYGNVNSSTPASGSSSVSFRVKRGGSWYDYASYCTVTIRDGNNPDSRYYYYGFRLVRSAQ